MKIRVKKYLGKFEFGGNPILLVDIDGVDYEVFRQGGLKLWVSRNLILSDADRAELTNQCEEFYRNIQKPIPQYVF